MWLLFSMAFVFVLGLLAMRRNYTTYHVGVDLASRIHECVLRDIAEVRRRSPTLSDAEHRELMESFDFGGRWLWFERTWNYDAFMWRPRFWRISTVDGYLDKVGRPDWM